MTINIMLVTDAGFHISQIKNGWLS